MYGQHGNVSIVVWQYIKSVMFQSLNVSKVYRDS